MSDAELQAIRERRDLVSLIVLHDFDALVAEVDRLRRDLAAVQRVAAGLADRIAAQSELLAKRAEKSG